MKQFKYKTVFAAKLKPVISKDIDRYLSLASKNNLSKFLPSDIDFDKKIDFLGLAGEAFIANKLNLNDDGVSTKEAVEIAKLFPYSFIDIEHSREKIAGVILTATFTEYGGDKVLTEEEVLTYTKPFSVTIGGIIWKAINPELTEYIEKSSDPTSESFGSIYCSWELAFNKAGIIVLDPDKKNFEDGQIITDEKEINRLENKLKAFGGTGFMENGKKIGRVPIGEVIPIAIGLTNTPAGQVKPIQITENENTETIAKTNTGFDNTSTKEAYDVASTPISKKNNDLITINPDYKFGVCPGCGYHSDYDTFIKTWNTGNASCQSCGNSYEIKDWQFSKESANNKIEEKNQKILSHLENADVKKDRIFMKINSIKDLTDENLKECKASEIQEAHRVDLETEMKKISDNYVKDKEAKDNLVNSTNEKLAQAKNEIEEIKKKNNDTEAKLKEIIEANKAKEKQELFSARVQTLEEKFDLSDKEREILASKVKSIENDADFTKFLDETEVLLAAKKKKPADKKKDDANDNDEDDAMADDMDAKKSAKASQTAVDDAIKNGKKDETIIPNTVTPPEPTMAEKAKSAFAIENWGVENKRKNRI